MKSCLNVADSLCAVHIKCFPNNSICIIISMNERTKLSLICINIGTAVHSISARGLPLEKILDKKCHQP